MKVYKAKGMVLGKCWGGGKGYYESEELQNEKLNDLKKEIKERIKNGMLDSGFGFDGLIGAVMEIVTIETIKKGNKEYKHYDSVISNFDLSADEFEEGKEFLLNS